VKERPLTPRQHQILRLVARGETNKEIAASLRISEQGVKAHISRLLERYGAANRVELVALTHAWSAADDRRYDALTADLNTIRDQLADSNAHNSPRTDFRTPTPLSPNATPRVTDALVSLRRVLNELDVAMRLARDMPSDNGRDALLDAVRTRSEAALEYTDAVTALVREQQTLETRERERVAT
jgi:DNA-binding CsgD family transcriptional regulator